VAISAGTADGIDHSSGGDRVNERGFPARCNDSVVLITEVE